MKDISVAITNLKSQWHSLHDIDRGHAIEKIRRAGASLRSLATELERSEALLRRLLEARRAPFEDQLLARKGTISINELIRRGRAAATGREEKKADDLKRKRERDAAKGCKNICDWIRSEGVSISCGENIVSEAREWLYSAERNKQLPGGVAPAGMPVAEIIQLCRPMEMTSDGYNYVAWYQLWLIRWAYYSFTDRWTRFTAIDLALEKQHTRIR